MLLSVDPGIRGCGVALFDDGKLVACDYVKNPMRSGSDVVAVRQMATAVREWYHGRHGVWPDVAIEWPRIYTASKSKGDNNDLMPLVGIGCAISAFFRLTEATSYFPHEWKGQDDKFVTYGRVYDRLDAAEYAVWQDAVKRLKSLAHNTTDAVGLGLFHIGRFDRKRALPR